MKRIEVLVDKLNKAHAKLQSAEGDLLSALAPHADFEIGLTFQPSDGWNATDEQANNCPLDKVVEEFILTGKVTHKNFLNNTI